MAPWGGGAREALMLLVVCQMAQKAGGGVVQHIQFEKYMV